MTVEGVRPRARRRTFVLGSLALGVVSFVCALSWEPPFLMLSAMALGWPLLLVVPNFEGIRKSRARPALEIPIAAVLLFFSPRVLCLAVVGLYVLFWCFVPTDRGNRWMNWAVAAFLLTMLLPVDIEAGGFHGPHMGTRGSGPRFVRVVKGKPMVRRLEAKYGEFIAGGCVVTGNDPLWLFVWEEAGLTTWKTRSARAQN